MWIALWPAAIVIVTTSERSHAQVHVILLAASAIVLTRLPRTALAFRATHRVGWALVALGQGAEAVGAYLDTRDGAVAESAHAAGQFLSLLAVMVFFGAGAVASFSARRSPLHAIASFVLFGTAAVVVAGLQVELPLAVVLPPALTWSILATLPASASPPARTGVALADVRVAGRAPG